MDTNDFASTIEELQQEVASLRRQNAEYQRLASFPQLNPNPVLEFDRMGQLGYLNPAAQKILSQYGLTDARVFLPNDFTEISRTASVKEGVPFFREIIIEGLIFNETIYYSQEYESIRIYANDISQRKQTEVALNQSRQELLQTQNFIEAVTKGAEVIIATIDNNFCYTYFNQAYQEEVKRLSGKDIQLGMSMLDTFAHLPEQLKVVEQEWTQVLNGESTNKNLEFGEPSQYQRVYNVLHTPIWDAEGNVVGAGEVAYNITEQVRTQEAFLESEARFRMVLKNAPVTVAAQDKDLRFIWAYNQRTVNPAEVIGKTDMDIFPPETAGWLTGLKRQVLETGNELTRQGWVTSGGQRLFLDLFLEPIRDKDGQIAGVGIATVDLTKIKLAEQALQESEERYHSLFEGMTEGFASIEIIYDENGKPSDYRFLDINPACERLTGLKRDIVINKSYHEVLPDEVDHWVKNFEKVVVFGEPVQTEIYSQSMNKHYKVFAYRYAPNQFAIIFIDMTDHKQLEDELRINLTKYSVLFDSLPLGVTVSDQNGQIIESNQEASQLLGLSDEEHKSRQIDGEEWKIIRPDRTPMPAEEFASVRALKEQRRIENVEMGIVKNNDQISWITVTASPLPLKNFGVVITYNDITKRVQAEEALRKAHDELEIIVQQRTQELSRINAYNRTLLESGIDTLVTITPDGKIGDVNAATEIVTGYSRAELIGTDFHSFFTDPEKARKGYQQVFDNGKVQDYELEIQHKNGHITPVVYNASVYRDESGEVAGVFAAARDITERKNTERQLMLLNTALESAANGIILVDKDGTILWSNSAFSRMTGYSGDEIVGQNPRFLKSGLQDQEYYRNLWDTILAGKVWHGELINRCKDGSLYNEDQTITPVVDQSGNVTNFISIRQDITEHKQDEEALRKSEEKYRSLVIATAQIVWQTNAAGDVVEDLPNWRAFTGQSLDEIIGQGWINALHPADQQRTANIWAHAVETKSLYDTEYRIKSRNGEYCHFAVRGVPVIDKDGSILSWIGTCTDITEKKRFETQLIQAEKHAVIGRMVGSVTHEINNPLQTVKNCLYLIKQDTPPDSPIEESLRMATSEIHRLANLVAQLRQLYRPQQDLTVRPYELLDIIEEVHSLIIHQLDDSHVVWQLVAGLQRCSIYCVRDQIIEVFLNICMNAIEAMQTHGGTLSIDMVFPIDRNQVGVKFSDSGPGITAEIMDHLFEPFTTTKESGLGLGLSICYGIIQKHGGQMMAESQPGLGTTFTIWLPLAVQGQETGE
jgi:PAS domain S-box-containing protein